MDEPRFFGHYLVSQGVITAAKLAAATEFQAQVNARLGEYAIERGLLSEADVKRITAKQISEDLMFGQVALKMGLLENTALNELLAAQRLDHVLLGEALVALGYTTEQEVDRALADFVQEEQRHAQNLYTIPPEVPMATCASSFFRLTHVLLQRAWGVRNKPGSVRLNSGTLRLSDWNAKADLSGDVAFKVAIALPNAIAQAWARQVYERDDVDDEDLAAVVRQFTSVVCANLSATLNNDQRISLAPSAPTEVDFCLPVPEGSQAVVMPYVTNNGQVFAAMVYDA
jgi:CheY-specific phosphatase CheX